LTGSVPDPDAWGMGKTGAAFRDAWRDYRAHFRELWVASALLALPMALVVFWRGIIAARVDLPFAASSTGALGFVDSLVGALTPAAVALLAADLRGGGTWGWRQGWGRAVVRVVPVVTGRVVGAVAVSLAVLAGLILLQLLPGGHDGPLWKAIAIAVVSGLVLVASAILALLPVVTSIGRAGGFGAVQETWRILRLDLRRSLATLALAQTLAALPFLLLFWVSFRSMPSVFALLVVRLYAISVSPFITLVALSIYWEARDAGGAGAAQLRADLDAR
jgi:hypothetical protein